MGGLGFQGWVENPMVCWVQDRVEPEFSIYDFFRCHRSKQSHLSHYTLPGRREPIPLVPGRTIASPNPILDTAGLSVPAQDRIELSKQVMYAG